MKPRFEYPKQIGGVSIQFYAWLAVLMVGLLPLGYSVGGYLLFGTPIFAEYVSSSVAWGLLVPVYVFFVLAGSGLCLIASLGHIFRIGDFELISRRAIFSDFFIQLNCLYARSGRPRRAKNPHRGHPSVQRRFRLT